MPDDLHIRRARPDEAAALTELTIRSKSHWNYDTAFLASVRHELEFHPEKFLPDFHVYVLDQNGTILGFCSLIPLTDEKMELHDLFVEPVHIGKGHGKRLWDFSVALLRTLGTRTLVLTADPHAEPFYLRQGAVRVGEKSSSAYPGRKLPILEYRLSD
jgi:N-acetylglutamate synthase-like GNAT family acetyltransferase